MSDRAKQLIESVVSGSGPIRDAINKAAALQEGIYVGQDEKQPGTKIMYKYEIKIGKGKLIILGAYRVFPDGSLLASVTSNSFDQYGNLSGSNLYSSLSSDFKDADAAEKFLKNLDPGTTMKKAG